MTFKGKVYKYGKNIDTDVIIPARRLVTKDAAVLASFCMEDLDSDFVETVAAGDIILGDTNFGCGSSREQAVIAIKGCAVKLVAAKSFARIFYRNCVNNGICPLEIDDTFYNGIHHKDVVSLELEKGIAINHTTGETIAFSPVQERILALLALSEKNG
ncbi:3-isopropylmalate dehydratase small subunit [Fusibacter paucivorans]|uniref:3-isopropylmalate dehydratase small subunit n=1 Tax=Fusibacter paucivorans TaxID=76009 RepID=A0ABS5PLN5_9FIRM|nr:3-isopropylmalate dehydratase small subunit [Fusibacter paucivorans]MBS7526080.1 3-isopropylmalate dehydratase small subunit [Fusibacter paucivorans]